MSRKSYPNVNAANQYARDVVRGKIVACQFVIQACQRHLDDLMAEKSKSFRYRFDKDLAERAAKFIQLLPHTKGEWAFKRMPITLEPWQLFVICCAFGWVNKGTRLRRFREVYTEIPVRTANQQSLPVLPCIVLPVITSSARKCIPVPRRRNRRGKSFVRHD